MPDQPSNPFQQFAPAAQQPANPFARFRQVQPPEVQTTSMMDAFWHGMAHGAVSTLQGTGQLAAHLGRSMGMVGDKFVERSDAEAQRYELAYGTQNEVIQHPWAAKAGEMAGSLTTAAPLMLLPGMGQATALGRLAAGTALGSVEGILQPVTQDKEEDFYTEKAWQGLRGTVGGAVGAGVGEVAGSVLSRAIARGDKGTTSMFRTAVRPSGRGVTSDAMLNKQDQRIVTAIDQVIFNRPNLKLTNEAGEQVTGELPRSLRQFSQALDQTKRDIYAKYDGLMRQAGAVAPPIDLVPIAQAVRASVSGRAVKAISPGVAKRANAIADRLEKDGAYTLSEAQDAVEHINQRTQGFWRSQSSDKASKGTLNQASLASVEADVASRLRFELNRSIDKLQGPGYQELRNTYGALRAVEENVVKAVVRNADRKAGGIGDFLKSIAEGAHIVGGVFTLHPGAVYRGVSVAAGRAWMKHLNDPNRAIEGLFDYRSKVLRQNVSQLRQAARDIEPQVRSRITELGGAVSGAEAAQ